MADKNRFSLAQPPFGWRYERVLVMHDGEQRALEIVRQMDGRASLREIAEAINATGLRNRMGRPFTHGSVPNLLKIARGEKEYDDAGR